jgi:hypothetical protein
MKILYVGLARSIWLFDFNLLNPKGLNLQGVLVAIGKRYQFAKIPASVIDVDERKGLPFKAGSFINSKGNPLLVTFTIFADGFVAETTSSTDDSTEFLVELTGWLKEEFGLTVPANVKKIWVSQIDYESDVSLANLNPQLERIIKFLKTRVKPSVEKDREYEVGALNFWSEDMAKPGAPAAVKFERKIDARFSDNHYFSQAPLQTQDHKDLINDLEKLLGT